MNARKYFLNWAIENGYSKVVVSEEVMQMFEAHLEHLYRKNNKPLVKGAVSNSVCSCPDDESAPVKWICTKCNKEWKP